jgi:hypothetical protein
MEMIKQLYGFKDGEYFLWLARFYLATMVEKNGESLIIDLSNLADRL